MNQRTSLDITRNFVYTERGVKDKKEIKLLQNITFSADEEHIRKARERAKARGTTLNEEFRNWLEKYVGRPVSAEDFMKIMERFEYVEPGRSFHRDEMNER